MVCAFLLVAEDMGQRVNRGGSATKILFAQIPNLAKLKRADDAEAEIPTNMPALVPALTIFHVDGSDVFLFAGGTQQIILFSKELGKPLAVGVGRGIASLSAHIVQGCSFQHIEMGFVKDRIQQNLLQ